MLQPLLPFLSALGLMLVLGPAFIAWAQQLFSAQVRAHTPATHQEKNNTPTMGGLLIVASIVLSLLFFADYGSTSLWIVLSCFGLFAAIGLLDDWGKISSKRGVSKKIKFGLQVLCAFIVVMLWYTTEPNTLLYFPLINYAPRLGIFIIPWGAFIIVATSNAVNFTDGLDGLAAGTLLPVFMLYGLIASTVDATLALVCAAVVGALLGFLRFNWYPAQLFMGDVGSLPLGATLGLLAIMIRHELLLIIAGGVFVLEALSVIIQIFCYHVLGRKFFRLAPIHHHFELAGLAELTVTMRFIALSCALCVLALIILVAQ